MREGRPVKSSSFKTLKARHQAFKKRHPMRRAALFLGLAGLVYAVASAVLAVAGSVPAAPVIAGMNVDNYYAWQILFIVPLVFAVWVLTSGVLLALGVKGSHRSDILVKAARAWGAPLFLAWVPMAVEAVFAALGMGQAEWVGLLSEPGVWQTTFLAFYAAAAAWTVLRFVRTARSIHKKSWPAAVSTGLAASAVAIGAYVLFVR